MSNHLEILRQNGKSFYWAGKLLPKKYFIRCAELYSFCRLLDDIADTKTKDENFIKLNFILDLIKENDYQKLEENNIRKCIVELRNNISGNYKGYVFCSSISEAENIKRIITNDLKSSNIKINK